MSNFYFLGALIVEKNSLVFLKKELNSQKKTPR
jgi:hypothetical protein